MNCIYLNRIDPMLTRNFSHFQTGIGFFPCNKKLPNFLCVSLAPYYKKSFNICVSVLTKKYYLWCQITQNALWINREKNTYHLHCLGVGYHIPFTVYFPIMPHSLCVSIIRMQHCMQQLRNISAKKNPMTVKFSGNACNR